MSIEKWKRISGGGEDLDYNENGQIDDRKKNEMICDFRFSICDLRYEKRIRGRRSRPISSIVNRKSQIERRKSSPGFTLIELLVVVAIIGVLASIALSKIFTAIETAREGQALANLQSLRTAITMYTAANGSYPVKLANAGIPNGDDIPDPSMVQYLQNGQFPINPIDGPLSNESLSFIWQEPTATNTGIIGLGTDGWIYFNVDAYTTCNSASPLHDGRPCYELAEPQF